MDRSNEQIIGDIAETIFAGALPPEWVTRPLPKDYGIDFSVEVFELNKSTGIIFDIQLKGSSKISFNSNGSHISFSIELKYLEYYLEQYQRPVFLVLCDVKTNAVYWLEMQSNKDLNAAYEKARGKQKSLSLHIPVCNRLPGTEKALLEAYQAMMVKVAARWNGKVSTPPDTGAPKVAMPRIPFPAAAGIAAALVALLLISWWFFFPTKPGPSHQSPKTDIAAPKRITVKGTIVDNTGMPVRGAKVTLFLEDAKNPFADDNSNSDGNFRFTGVPFKKDKLSRVKVTLNGRDVHDELFTLPGPLKIVL